MTARTDDLHIERLLVRSTRAAELLDMPPETLRGLTRAGRVRCVKVGRSVYYTLDDLREFVASLRGAK